MQTYTFSDLSEHSTQVLRNAEDGKLALFTNQGQPVFVAVPFDEMILKSGLIVDLAIKLFDEEAISLGRAAEIARMNRIDFMNLLGNMGIPVVRYSPGELEEELKLLA